jgi:hypothetical protein
VRERFTGVARTLRGRFGAVTEKLPCWSKILVTRCNGEVGCQSAPEGALILSKARSRANSFRFSGILEHDGAKRLLAVDARRQST